MKMDVELSLKRMPDGSYVPLNDEAKGRSVVHQERDWLVHSFDGWARSRGGFMEPRRRTDAQGINHQDHEHGPEKRWWDAATGWGSLVGGRRGLFGGGAHAQSLTKQASGIEGDLENNHGGCGWIVEERSGALEFGLRRAHGTAAGGNFLETVLGLKLGIFRAKQSEDFLCCFVAEVDFENVTVVRGTIAEPDEQFSNGGSAGDVADAFRNLLHRGGDDLLHAASMQEQSTELNGKNLNGIARRPWRARGAE